MGFNTFMKLLSEIVLNRDGRYDVCALRLFLTPAKLLKIMLLTSGIKHTEETMEIWFFSLPSLMRENKRITPVMCPLLF